MSWTITDKLLLSSLLPSEPSHARLRRLLNDQSSEIDWPTALHRAESYGTAALLRFNLAQIGALESVPPTIRARLERASHEWAARHLAYISEAARLIEAFAAGAITTLPLKGAALMLGGYYPQAGLRAAVDMDLLVEPSQIDGAERIAAACGYVEIGKRSQLRARQRLPNELNHLPPRRGLSGLILELHHRAFHYTSGARDVGFAEMSERAGHRLTTAGATLLLPAAEDLCLHLAHHTMADLQSTQAILRTLADLHFIFQREPGAKEKWRQRATEFGLAGAIHLACESLRLVADGTLEELEGMSPQAEATLLLETALLAEPAALAEAARLCEYFDLRRRPLEKLGNLCALVFTTKQHLAQRYGADETQRLYFNYLRRPLDLLRKFNWASLAPANLKRVLRLRKIVAGKN